MTMAPTPQRRLFLATLTSDPEPYCDQADPSRRWHPHRSEDQDAAPVSRLATPAVTTLFVSLTGIGFAVGAMTAW
ncbi:hypothetical protein SAMN05216483_5836 [Streptomyces sp. 2131.1]|nr:hypothetical protein SAMN05216483_5836 [Streptomyces sp. 2131.1]